MLGLIAAVVVVVLTFSSLSVTSTLTRAWQAIGSIGRLEGMSDRLIAQSLRDFSVEARPQLDRVTLGRLERAEASAGFDVYAVFDVPDGYRLRSVLVRSHGAGKLAQSSFTDPERGMFVNLIQATLNGSPFFRPRTEHRVTPVMVRGGDGVWAEGVTLIRRAVWTASAEEVRTNWLLWQEDGFDFAIYGTGLSLDDALRIAESLSPVLLSK